MSQLFEEKDFVNLSKPSGQRIRRSKAPIAIGALLLFMIGGALFPTMIPILALASVLITLITRCIDPEEAYQAVEWRVIFMIFGMLGLGMALDKTGLAEGCGSVGRQHVPGIRSSCGFAGSLSPHRRDDRNDQQQRGGRSSDAHRDRGGIEARSRPQTLCHRGDVRLFSEFCHPHRLSDEHLRLRGWRI